MYIIKDWAGNILNYKGRFELPCFAVPMEFISWDYAEDYIQEHLNHNDRGDLWICDKED